LACSGTARDLLDAVYQYPGGWLSDRIGSRNALVLFAALAGAGYLVLCVQPKLALRLRRARVRVWRGRALASPAMFAMIAEHLPRERRAMGFTVQANSQKRVPVMLSPRPVGF